MQFDKTTTFVAGTAATIQMKLTRFSNVIKEVCQTALFFRGLCYDDNEKIVSLKTIRPRFIFVISFFVIKSENIRINAIVTFDI